MNDTDQPFESPKLLIARAKENLADFDARYRAYLETRPYEALTEDDAKTGDKILKLRVTAPIPGIMRVVLSDCFNNCRHALDQAVNEAAVALRGGERNCYFPFGKNAKEFSFIYGGRRYQYIPIELRPYLNGLQPYFGGNDLLYALSKLAGPNKHQIVLRLFAGSMGGVDISAKRASKVAFLPPVWNRAKGELPVARIEPGGELHTDIGFTPLIAVVDPAVHGLQASPGMAETFISMAERIVEGIEAEAMRLLAAKGNHGQASAPAA